MDFQGTIEVYQDVSFEFPRNKCPTLRRKLGENTGKPWTFDQDYERRVKKATSNDVEIITFLRDTHDTDSCYVTLWGDSTESWRIPNVVPTNYGNKLSIKDYNDLLNEFVNRILSPTMKSLNRELLVTERQLAVQDMMSEESFRKLKTKETKDLFLERPCRLQCYAPKRFTTLK